ncbi:hypothetical protein HYH03_003291 [Edaphochlamys debaryana]|uniref:Uncharacterized protein n=1 Tax=Edaphochlamys debaryana TaxID=47281 RepID=A0A835Y919_9CHLO|nr:hypothetical protein HYH03_003291 [Edaphochlamys debaryana]|eukprot:KAG2498540.1 hypothetical protein HYH03_003291 [Edaphochlamys debaryana]
MSKANLVRGNPGSSRRVGMARLQYGDSLDLEVDLDAYVEPLQIQDLVEAEAAQTAAAAAHSAPLDAPSPDLWDRSLVDSVSGSTEAAASVLERPPQGATLFARRATPPAPGALSASATPVSLQALGRAGTFGRASSGTGVASSGPGMGPGRASSGTGMASPGMGQPPTRPPSGQGAVSSPVQALSGAEAREGPGLTGSGLGISVGFLFRSSISGVDMSTSTNSGANTGVGTGASSVLSGAGTARAASPGGARLLPRVSSQAAYQSGAGTNTASTPGPGGLGLPVVSGQGPQSPVGRSSSVSRSRGWGGDDMARSSKMLTQLSSLAQEPIEPAGGYGMYGNRCSSPSGRLGSSGGGGGGGTGSGTPRSYSRRSQEAGPWFTGTNNAGPGSGDGPESPTRSLHSRSGPRGGTGGGEAPAPGQAPPPSRGGSSGRPPALSVSVGPDAGGDGGGGYEAPTSPLAASSPLPRSPMPPPGLPSRPSMRRGAAGSLSGADSPTAAAIAAAGGPAAMGSRLSGAAPALQALGGSRSLAYRRPLLSEGGSPPAAAPAPPACSSPIGGSRSGPLVGPGRSAGGGGGGEAAHQGSSGGPPLGLSSPLGRGSLSRGAYLGAGAVGGGVSAGGGDGPDGSEAGAGRDGAFKRSNSLLPSL